MVSQAETIAEILHQVGAIQVNTESQFRWSSGMLSPIYCDNRLTLFETKIRRDITKAYISLIKQYFPEINLIAGVATGGIAQAALTANACNWNMVYVRPNKKRHGLERQVEGLIQKKSNERTSIQKAVVIEDLISTGGSSLNAVEALQQQDIVVLGVIAIFSYELDKAKRAFSDARIPLYTLSNYTALKKVLTKNKFLNQAQITVLEEWYNLFNRTKL